MKKSIQIAVLLVFCISNFATAQWFSKEQIKGNNKLISQKISTQSYEKISVSSSIDVLLVTGKEGELILKAEENLIEYIEIGVKKNTLSIKIRNNTNINNIKQILVIVPVEEINELSVAGSSDVSGDLVLVSEKLNLSVAGSGDLKLSIDTEILNAKVAGSGTLILKGNAKNCDFNVAGSGDIDGKRLNCENVIARVAGSGDCSFTCNNTLKAYVVGSGSVEYTGNPEVLESNTLGSGSIEKRD